MIGRRNRNSSHLSVYAYVAACACMCLLSVWAKKKKKNQHHHHHHHQSNSLTEWMAIQTKNNINGNDKLQHGSVWVKVFGFVVYTPLVNGDRFANSFHFGWISFSLLGICIRIWFQIAYYAHIIHIRWIKMIRKRVPQISIL